MRSSPRLDPAFITEFRDELAPILTDAVTLTNDAVLRRKEQFNDAKSASYDVVAEFIDGACEEQV